MLFIVKNSSMQAQSVYTAKCPHSMLVKFPYVIMKSLDWIAGPVIMNQITQSIQR